MRLMQLALALVAGTLVVGPAAAQQGAEPAKAPAKAATAAVPRPTLQKLTGVWVEGPGFDITYGKDYDTCAKRCLGTPKCVMIEYYRPEKKCNLYDTVRPRLKGGSSIVGIRN